MNAFLGQFFSLKTHLLYEFMRRKVYLSYWNYWLYSILIYLNIASKIQPTIKFLRNLAMDLEVFYRNGLRYLK